MIGAQYIVLDDPDGELTPALEVQRQTVQTTRESRPDLVVSPRPNDIVRIEPEGVVPGLLRARRGHFDNEGRRILRSAH